MDKLNDKDYVSYEEKIFKTSTPYYHVGNTSIFQKFRYSVYRMTSIVNPFAKKQVQKKDEITYPAFQGFNFYRTPELPNPFGFNIIYPVHMDATKQENLKQGQGPQLAMDQEASANITFENIRLPLACEKSVNKFRRCEMINGFDKCEEEGNFVVQMCPNFALDMLREDKLKNEINRNIQLEEYQEAMRISDYNKGRKLQDVDGSKTKIHGTRQHLRPDTLWADDRYVNVTQEEVDQAKLRYQARQGEKTGIFIMEKQPDDLADINRRKPLYGL